MKYNWIDPNEFTMDSFLLLDRWCLNWIFRGKDEIYIEEMAKALYFYPHVKMFIRSKAKECTEFLNRLDQINCSRLTKEEAKKSEKYIIRYHETFIVYAYPELMENINYIKNWSPENLYALVNLDDKLVLDVGAGTGRLAFAAAKRAKMVYASEPCDQLREYMRDKIKKLGIANVKVLDGYVQCLPYEDNTFDVVLCGHVIGDHYDEEIMELTRITKHGGYIASCNGDDEFIREAPNPEMIKRGFSFRKHESVEGGIIFDYVKRIQKRLEA